MTARLTPDGRPVAHEVHIEDGRFAHAACTCGWRSAARRDRRGLRTEARDHVLLYASATSGEAAISIPAERADQTAS